MASEA